MSSGRHFNIALVRRLREFSSLAELVRLLQCAVANLKLKIPFSDHNVESRIFCCTQHEVIAPVLWIRNDLFRIRIQLWIFRVPDPDPDKSSGSMRIRIHVHCPIVQIDQNSLFYLYALLLFAGSGSGTLIPDPDPGKSSGSMRIRIHNTEFYWLVNEESVLTDAVSNVVRNLRIQTEQRETSLLTETQHKGELPRSGLPCYTSKIQSYHCL